MKFYFSSIIFIVFLPAIGFSQDIITKIDGTDIKSRVQEVNETHVVYKNFDNLKGPNYVISKNDLIMIRYENGTKDLFYKTNKPDNSNEVKENAETKDENKLVLNSGAVVDINTMDSTALMRQAEADASFYYKGKKSGADAVYWISAIGSPVLGIAPALIINSKEPLDANLRYPNQKLFEKPAYRKAYKEEAHRIKKIKVWVMYGVGSAVSIILYGLGLGLASI
jgi:hypothetical protein